MKALAAVVLALAFTLPAYATPTCWVLQPANSRLTFVGDQAGAPARGTFGKFAATFCFDTAHATGKLRVNVHVASLDTHNSRRNAVLKGKQFLAVQQHPQATYEAHSFARQKDGSYVASGTLRLKGVVHPAQAHFRFQSQDGNTAMVTGQASIHRLDFGVGTGRWTNTHWVGADVVLKFHLQLRREVDSGK